MNFRPFFCYNTRRNFISMYHKKIKAFAINPWGIQTYAHILYPRSDSSFILFHFYERHCMKKKEMGEIESCKVFFPSYSHLLVSFSASSFSAISVTVCYFMVLRYVVWWTSLFSWRAKRPPSLQFFMCFFFLLWLPFVDKLIKT